MTRALVTCLTLAAAVSLGAQTPTPTRPATAPPPVKIAFVSSRAIMQQTPGYAAADSALNRDIQAGRDEIARLQQQHRIVFFHDQPARRQGIIEIGTLPKEHRLTSAAIRGVAVCSKAAEQYPGGRHQQRHCRQRGREAGPTAQLQEPAAWKSHDVLQNHSKAARCCT